MDEDMEIEPVFEAYEIDLDYEFDASRYFDFTREENTAEGRQAELWFESAQSYPPSRESIYLNSFSSFLLLMLYYYKDRLLGE